MAQLIFYILSIMAIFSALMVVFSRNAMYSVLYLVVTFVSITLHYLLLLNASFLGIVNIIVYAGAIMVLFLYVIMLLNLNASIESNKQTISRFIAVGSGIIFLLVLIGALRGLVPVTPVENAGITDIGNVKNLGKVLYTDFVLPFEISSVLFLSAMVGAVLLGKKQVN
ncbi:MAG: NADH-quinone oxidoreductase subunit J [Sphingobacteriales bacterium]|nr:MAG: NADH-quinone oxidoreductase subunit J [Sphingobacteriales bacterium]